jgi:ACS family hexuronate transporter-like MFS transporter
VIAVGGVGMASLLITLWLTELGPLAACFAVSTCAYAALSTMVLNLPADLYDRRAVASVSGFSGTGAGLGTIAATLGIGVVTDHYSFAPVLVVASIAPLLAVAAVLILVRNTPTSGDGLLRRI